MLHILLVVLMMFIVIFSPWLQLDVVAILIQWFFLWDQFTVVSGKCDLEDTYAYKWIGKYFY